MKENNNQNVCVDNGNQNNIPYNYQQNYQADYCMNYQYQGENNCFQDSQMPDYYIQTNTGKRNKKNCKIIIAFVISLVAVAFVFFVIGFVKGEKNNKDGKDSAQMVNIITEGTWDDKDNSDEEIVIDDSVATTEVIIDNNSNYDSTENVVDESTVEVQNADDEVNGIPSTTEMSDNNEWINFGISIRGKSYSWPIYTSQLIEDGYCLWNEDSINDVVKAHDSSGVYSMYYKDNDSAWFNVTFQNTSDLDKTLLECEIYSMSFYDERSFGTEGVNDLDVVLCNFVKIGDNYEDVITIMGTPSKEEEIIKDERKLENVTYYHNGDYYISFQFENRKLTYIYISCLRI